MRRARLWRPNLILGVVLLALWARVPPVGAQDHLKIEVVPNIPHSSRVASVAFSPDGVRVLSGSTDWNIKLWDVATGALLRAASPSPVGPRGTPGAIAPHA
jgi:WD40 repeat protein